MMRYWYILISVLLSAVSCSDKKSKAVSASEASEFYKAINLEINLSGYSQKKFLNALEKEQAKGESLYKMDTTELKLLKQMWQSAYAINLVCETDVAKVTEVDSMIKLKSITLNYMQTVNSLFENELAECIDILGGNKVARFHDYILVLEKAFASYRAAQDNVSNAKQAFRLKYELKDFK